MPPLHRSLHLAVLKTRRKPPKTEHLIPSAADSAQEAALLSRLRASTPAYIADDGTVIPERAYLDVARIRVLERVRRERERERNVRAMRRWRAEQEAAKSRGGELGSVSKELSWGMRWRDEGIWWAVAAVAGGIVGGKIPARRRRREVPVRRAADAMEIDFGNVGDAENAENGGSGGVRNRQTSARAKSRPLTISRREKNLRQWAKEAKDIQEALEKISI